ncbi:hypothetical protein BDZ45DRAFT_801381 [Acephala macrosclerotiorum]|nr:hypothetical protein BDZ45DRAFT_801381 [Acephala macrosclerotiorum]
MGLAPDPVDVAYALAIFVLIYSIPSIWSLITGSWRVVKNPNHGEALYEDKDGAATVESTKEFSNKTQFIIIFVVAVIGLALSIGDFVFLTTSKLHIFDGSPSDNGDDNNVLGIVLLVPAWFLLLLQLFSISRLVEPVVKFKAITARLTTCFLIAGLIFSRYSFHWGIDVLATAGKEKFENSDMLAIDHIVRSEDATARFRNIVIKEDSLPLWVQIFWAFSWELTSQWLGILFSNFSDVAPAFATLQLLQYLETRQDVDAIEPGAWKYVAGIVAATVSWLMVDSRLIWWIMTAMFDS